MYKKHPNFPAPEENTALWRFMEFSKFVSLLDKQALFFVRVDKLEDPYEALFSRATFNKHILPANPDLAEGDAYAFSRRVIGDMRTWTLINCWHMNPQESAAMWRLYADAEKSVAIRSTFRRLRDSFVREEREIYIGAVRYINYDEEVIPFSNYFEAVLHKRLSFEHERELRGVILATDDADLNTGKKTGISIPVDLTTLVEEIVVAPNGPAWFYETVKSVTAKYGMGAAVTKSKLYCLE